MVLLVRPGSVPIAIIVAVHLEENGVVLTKELEVTLSTNELVEAHVRLQGDTRRGIADIGVVTRDESEPLAFGFPGEIGYSICKCSMRAQKKIIQYAYP